MNDRAGPRTLPAAEELVDADDRRIAAAFRRSLWFIGIAALLIAGVVIVNQLPRSKSPVKEALVEPPVAQPRPDASEQLKRAVALHQSGKLSEAEALYRSVLDQRPDDFDALHLIGVIHYQRGGSLQWRRSAVALL